MPRSSFTQPDNRVIDSSSNRHVMALTLDSSTAYRRGLLRCITSRIGDVSIKGYIDKSKLYQVEGDLLHYTIGDSLMMRGEQELIDAIGKREEFLGFEDPDIWFDDATSIVHIYFTIPFLHSARPKHTSVHLGHASGRDLQSLVITSPLLSPSADVPKGAKELVVMPKNRNNIRLNLVESFALGERQHYHSVIRVAIAENPDRDWQFGDIIFHPKTDGHTWCNGHVSPGPVFPAEFINIGKGKVVGVINGREANQYDGEKVRYGRFAIGLMIYDYDNGKIEWVSKVPWIVDSEAKNITFASQFVQTGQNEGLLYAHVDDSFVRAYKINAAGITELLYRL